MPEVVFAGNDILGCGCHRVCTCTRKGHGGMVGGLVAAAGAAAVPGIIALARGRGRKHHNEDGRRRDHEFIHISEVERDERERERHERRHDCYVTQGEAKLEAVIAKQADVIAKLESERYTDHKTECVEEKLENKIGKVQAEVNNLRVATARLGDAVEFNCKIAARDFKDALEEIKETKRCLTHSIDEQSKWFSHLLQDACEDERNDVKNIYEEIKEIRPWVADNFVPQEKGLVDGRRINYHGVDPRLRIKCNDDRFDAAMPQTVIFDSNDNTNQNTVIVQLKEERDRYKQEYERERSHRLEREERERDRRARKD